MDTACRLHIEKAMENTIFTQTIIPPPDAEPGRQDPAVPEPAPDPYPVTDPIRPPDPTEPEPFPTPPEPIPEYPPDVNF